MLLRRILLSVMYSILRWRTTAHDISVDPRGIEIMVYGTSIGSLAVLGIVGARSELSPHERARVHMCRRPYHDRSVGQPCMNSSNVITRAASSIWIRRASLTSCTRTTIKTLRTQVQSCARRRWLPPRLPDQSPARCKQDHLL